MTYLRTPDESPLYEADQAKLGYVANYTRVMALRPEAYAAWEHLNRAVRDGMDLRRYELVTLAAARSLGSAYCSLAHTNVLRNRFYDDESLGAILADHHDAGLAAVDVAIMDFAARIAVRPGQATDADYASLREHGLSEVDIMQVVLAVGIRRFFSGVLETVGAQPDAAYDVLAPALRSLLPNGPSGPSDPSNPTVL